ncbi:MAG: ATP-grasp domain-containing protein [Acetobacteraceae bacterium]|nr:ATP-grasp domain-containing protein [Acetobacteraceae bacterium]
MGDGTLHGRQAGRGGARRGVAGLRHVLVIGSDRMEPVELLLSDPEVRVSAMCKPKYAHLYEGKADVWTVDDVADLAQARAAMLRILERHPVDAIVTPIERAVLTGGFLRSFYGVPGLTFEQCLRCTNKYLMKRCFSGAGLPVTGFLRLDRLDDLPRAADLLGWPVVLKPTMGSGTMHVRVIEDEAEFERLRASGGFDAILGLGVPLLLERYVDMEAEYHCDSAVFGGEVRFAAVGRYHWPPLKQQGWGGSALCDPEDDPAVPGVLELNRRALKALGLEAAVTHLEVFKTAGGLLVGEVAVRPGGGGIQDALRLKYGDDLQEAFVRAAQGLEPRLRLAPIKDAVGALGLPSKNGRVRYITPAEELERLPGVARAKLYHGPGDLIQEKLTSVFFSGVCVLRANDHAGLRRAVEAVQAAFRLEVG